MVFISETLNDFPTKKGKRKGRLLSLISAQYCTALLGIELRVSP
jgi:hypothetical protein